MSVSVSGQSVAEFLSSVLPVPGNSRLEDEFQRPLVTLTFAQSLDGKIAGKGGRQLILSGKESMLMTHWYDIDLKLIYSSLMIPKEGCAPSTMPS